MLDFDEKYLFPRFLQNDKTANALIKAICVALNAFCTVSNQGIQAIIDPDKMPLRRLDEMAWEYNLKWYDFGADIADKRETVKNAMEYYSNLGTPSAVERAISDIFGEGRVSEWFDYSGTAYHYNVYTTDPLASTTKRAQFVNVLAAVAPVRCTLDNIIYEGAEGKATEYALTRGAGMVIRAYSGIAEESGV